MQGLRWLILPLGWQIGSFLLSRRTRKDCSALGRKREYSQWLGSWKNIWRGDEYVFSALQPSPHCHTLWLTGGCPSWVRIPNFLFKNNGMLVTGLILALSQTMKYINSHSSCNLLTPFCEDYVKHPTFMFTNPHNNSTSPFWKWPKTDLVSERLSHFPKVTG